MKRILKKIVTAAAISATIFIASCDKDQTVIPVTRTEILSGKNWKITALTVDPARNYGVFGPSVTDWYAQYRDCEKDNLYYYSKDKMMNFDEGSTKCNPNDPQTIAGTWTLNTDETVITQVVNKDTKSINISELSVKTFKGTYQELSFGTTYTYTITMKAQ